MRIYSVKHYTRYFLTLTLFIAVDYFLRQVKM